MPALEDYISESDQYDEEALDLIPTELRTQINSQLDAAVSDGDAVETE